MEYQSHHLLRPLIHSTATTYSVAAASSFPQEDEMNPSNSDPGIIFRISLIISIGLIAFWANHEASKGFSITIINDAVHDTLPARYFSVFYVATDKASRIVYTSSKFVEDFLYPNETYIKKNVSHVILRLSSRNLTESVIVESGPDGEFVIYISPSVMTEMNHDQALHLAVRKGMARIWIYDGLGGAPTNLVDGMVECISGLAFSGGLSTDGDVGWPDGEAVGLGAYRKSKNTAEMVRYLNYHEMKSVGFIRRLSQNLRNRWQDWMVDDALRTT